jgi:hypothetical protein
MLEFKEKEKKKKTKEALIEMKKTDTKKVVSELESVILDSMIGNIPCVQ